MKKLSTKWFRRWSQKANLRNEDLLKAISDLTEGLSVADLGGNLYKVRVRRGNRGKSSGYRTLVVYKKDDRAIFLYGFSKNEKANIGAVELQYFKKLGSDLMALETHQLTKSVDQKILFDIEVPE